MKKRSLLILLVAAAVQFACQPTSQVSNRPANQSAPAPKEVIDTAAIEKELLQLERDWASTAVTHNADIIRQVEADDISVTYPDGTMGSKEQDIKDVGSGALSAEAWDLSDLKVRVLDADAAVVTGRGVIKNGKYKTADGKIQNISGEYRFTDVFARRNGKWQAVASHASTIANPTPVPSPTKSAAADTKGSPSPPGE